MSIPLSVSVGDTYEKWTIIAISSRRNNQGKLLLVCQCRCGTIVERTVHHWRKYKGCVHCKWSLSTLRHGHTQERILSPTWRAWSEMRRRCNDPACYGWPWYGGKGITVCERWNFFEHFLADMGEHPGKEYSLDRIDSTQSYTPENCRWATIKQQHRNTTRNVLLSYHGETKPLCDWAEEIGIKVATLRGRLYHGWSIERAFITPIQFRGWEARKRRVKETSESGLLAIPTSQEETEA